MNAISIGPKNISLEFANKIRTKEDPTTGSSYIKGTACKYNCYTWTSFEWTKSEIPEQLRQANICFLLCLNKLFTFLLMEAAFHVITCKVFTFQDTENGKASKKSMFNLHFSIIRILTVEKATPSRIVSAITKLFELIKWNFRPPLNIDWTRTPIASKVRIIPKFIWNFLEKKHWKIAHQSEWNPEAQNGWPDRFGVMSV